MTRTLGVVLLGALALLVAPGVAALALDADATADATVQGATGLDASLPIDVPTVDLPLAAPLPLVPVGDASSGAPPGAASDGGTMQGTTTGLGLTPTQERVAAAATGGAALAVLLGLVAHLAGVPLFSRIQGSHLLDNEVRQRVHGAVEANPGITIKEIVGVCGIGWGTAVYHLKRLEAERLVVSERQRQFRRFYKNGGGIVNDAKAAFGELKNPTSDRIARQVLSRPGACQKDLCEAVGISAPLASKFLGRLAQAGLVAAHREWKTVKYFPTPKLEDLLHAVAKPAAAMVEATVVQPVAVAA